MIIQGCRSYYLRIKYSRTQTIANIVGRRTDTFICDNRFQNFKYNDKHQESSFSLVSIWNRLILYKKAVLFIIFIDLRWSTLLNGHYESSAENVASTAGYKCVPMRRSGLESVIWDPSDCSKSIESMNPFPGFIRSFNALLSVEWSWIANPDPDHPNGTHP